MTVKLANFFSSASAASMSMPTTTGAVPTAVTVPPSPPITHASNIGSYSHHHHQSEQQQQQQQQQQQSLSTIPYNPYLTDDMNGVDMYDDDNMSLYSNATSASGIMMQRGHSCNNSQRPLLGERKPPKILNTTTKKNKKSSTSINQPQRHLQQQKQQQCQRQPGKPQIQKSYISPYVQQQKRDSAKGLHGFNDFDILSQQYTEHLRSSPHIGYPYGSPPSPTAKSNDFVFDTLIMPKQEKQQQKHTNYYQQQQQHQKQQQREENASDYSYYKRTDACNGGNNSGSGSGSASGSGSSINGSLGPLTSNINNFSNAHYMGKPSRFEDDFCTRRNATFATPQSQSQLQSQQLAASENTCGGAADDIGGPFIFGGMPHDRFNDVKLQHQKQQYQNPQLQQQHLQQDFSSSPLAAAVTRSSTDSVLEVTDKYSLPFIGQAIVQTSSDTSSSSRDSSSNKGAKFLLRKGKSKRNTKDKKSDSSAVQVKARQLQKQQEQQPQIHETPSIKCVLVGDGAVGKTNLILSYLKNRFNTEHVPTASDIYNADVLVNDSPVRLTICDTAGQDTLDKLRQLCYPDSDVFLLCFSVVKPDTFNAVKMKWAPKFSKTKAALLLVGTQADLRNDARVLNKLQLNGEKPISYADAWDLAATVGAKYIETSSATQDKVKEVFDTAIWEGLAPTTLPPTPTPPLWKKLLCLA